MNLLIRSLLYEKYCHSVMKGLAGLFKVFWGAFKNHTHDIRVVGTICKVLE